MLKIKVLGRGLIPRGYGLAPCKEPFPADLMLIKTILSSPNLKVKMVHPSDGHLVDVTRKNVDKLWATCSDKYGSNVMAGKSKQDQAAKKNPAKTSDDKATSNPKSTPKEEAATPVAKPAVEKVKTPAETTKDTSTKTDVSTEAAKAVDPKVDEIAPTEKKDTADAASATAEAGKQPEAEKKSANSTFHPITATNKK